MHPFQTIADIIIKGAIVTGPFAALLLFNKKPRRPFLISIVLCLSVIVSHSYFIRGVIGHFIESPFIIAEPFIFLISPLLYFYFVYIVENRRKHSVSDLTHIIPFIFFFASFIPISFHGKDTVYYDFLFSNKIVVTGFLWIVMIVQFLYYYSKLYKLNKVYTSKLAAQHSNYQQYDASWIRIFLILFLSMLAFVSMVLFVFLHNSSFEHFSTIVALFFSLQVYFVAYKGLNQKTIELEEDFPFDDFVKNKERVTNSPEKDRLLSFMETHKPYLNPDLTLIDLAHRLSLSRNELSALINNELGSNFYTFVNEFRVTHVKQLLQNDKAKQFTILALAYEGGFNSKSTFNAIFKKLTGLTPSQYRDSLG